MNRGRLSVMLATTVLIACGGGESGGSPVQHALPQETHAEPSIAPALAVNDRGHAVLAWPQTTPSDGAYLVVRRYTSGR